MAAINPSFSSSSSSLRDDSLKGLFRQFRQIGSVSCFIFQVSCISNLLTASLLSSISWKIFTSLFSSFFLLYDYAMRPKTATHTPSSYRIMFLLSVPFLFFHGF